eukprot:PhM_4_TR11171/c0_g1_i1/m.54010
MRKVSASWNVCPVVGANSTEPAAVPMASPTAPPATTTPQSTPMVIVRSVLGVVNEYDVCLGGVTTATIPTNGMPFNSNPGRLYLTDGGKAHATDATVPTSLASTRNHQCRVALLLSRLPGPIPRSWYTGPTAADCLSRVSSSAFKMATRMPPAPQLNDRLTVTFRRCRVDVEAPGGRDTAGGSVGEPGGAVGVGLAVGGSVAVGWGDIVVVFVVARTRRGRVSKRSNNNNINNNIMRIIGDNVYNGCRLSDERSLAC